MCTDLSAIPLTEPQKNVSVEEMTMIVPSGQFEQILLLKTTRKSEKEQRIKWIEYTEVRIRKRIIPSRKLRCRKKGKKKQSIKKCP